jgi:hypothetical protein
MLCFGSKSVYAKSEIRVGDVINCTGVLVFYGSFNAAVCAADCTTSNNKLIGNNETQWTPFPSVHETERVGQNRPTMRTFPNLFLITSGGYIL